MVRPALFVRGSVIGLSLDDGGQGRLSEKVLASWHAVCSVSRQSAAVGFVSRPRCRPPYCFRLESRALLVGIQLFTVDNLIQFIKYGLAGGLATVTHIAVFHLAAWKLFPALQPKDHLVRLLALQLRPIEEHHRARNSMICNVLAFLVSNMVAYITNVLWVFQAGRHPFIIEIALFYCVSGLSVLIGTLLMGLLIKRFGMLTTYAFVANIVSAVLINYAVRKFFIFQG